MPVSLAFGCMEVHGFKHSPSRKETGHHLQGYAYILFFIRSGANLAQSFTEVTIKQKENKIPSFLTVRPDFGPNTKSVFAAIYLFILPHSKKNLVNRSPQRKHIFSLIV
jgi:hypothetical protein